MLNAFKINALNHLTVITFGLPKYAAELNMTGSYSHRMNQSFAPRYDFKKDMAKLPRFVILVGDEDEAFLAEEYAPLLDGFDNQGSVERLKGLSHLGVIDAEAVFEKIANFIAL